MPEGVCIVGSTEISELDLHPWAHPPRTRIARSLLDMTIESRRERRCRADLLAGCQQGRTRPEALAEALTRRGPWEFDDLCSRLPPRQRSSRSTATATKSRAR